MVSDRREDLPINARIITADTLSGPVSDRSITRGGGELGDQARQFRLADLSITDPTRQCIVLVRRPDKRRSTWSSSGAQDLRPVALSLRNRAGAAVTSGRMACTVAVDVASRGPCSVDNFFSYCPASRRSCSSRPK